MEQTQNRLGMMMANNSTIVGKLNITEDDIELKDCVSFATNVVPTQDGRLAQIYIGNIIGDLIYSPETATFLTVEKTSPFYVEYYKLVSGVDLSIPPGGMKGLKSA